jgi:hypothetical protein
VPIVKPGKDALLSGWYYRPISMLACGRKLMEKMIYIHVWTFGQKGMAYCEKVRIENEKVREIVWRC